MNRIKSPWTAWTAWRALAALCSALLAATPVLAADIVKASMVTTADGTRLAVREWGNPQGPSILFVHGIAQSQLSFNKQVRSELAQKYRMVTYDLRGHGASDKPTDAAFYTDGRRWSDDIKAVMAATGLNKPVLVGWSLGGRIVAQYLADYGDGDIAGVNFVGARIVKDRTQSPPLPGSLLLRGMLSEDLEQNIRATAEFVRACVSQPLTQADFELMLGFNMASPTLARAATLKWSGGTDYAAVLPTVKVPVLITQGRRDQVVLPGIAGQAAELMKTARVSWYESAGHSPFWDDPVRFNAELAAFVDSLKP